MKGRKKMVAIVVFFVLWLAGTPSHTGHASANISAHAAAVIDVESGRVLFEKNGMDRLRIASLTKIMTSIVAIEEGKLNEVVTTPDIAVGTEGSSIYLRKDEKLTLEQLLYGLMLRSGNDAAVAIAHHVGGSVEGFVRLMNEKVEYLGLEQTHFTNPHGLDTKYGPYSTAVEMAQISRYALQNEMFRQIVSTKKIDIPQAGEKWDRKLINKNKMLRYYKHADGVKTGYTRLAKRCLVSSASKDGRQIAVVSLNAPNDWADHTKLLDYGFENFQRTKIIGKHEKVSEEENLITFNSFYYPLKEGEWKHIRKEVVMEKGYRDMLLGGIAGYLHIYLEDKLIGKIALLYS